MPILASRGITVSSGAPVGFFASTTGSSSGDGSIGNPWDLPTAFAGGHTHILQAGETCWVRGGIYNDSNNYVLSCSGTSGNPIIFRSYPGELAQIVGPSRNGTQVAVIDSESGHDRRFMDFEIYCSDTDRTSNGERIGGIDLGLRDDLINNIIHDCGQGVAGFFDGPCTIYGNIVYYNGSDNDWDTRSHNLYVHNASTFVKLLRHNVFFRSSGFNTHLFASGTVSTSQVDYMHLEQNVSYDAGILDTSLGTGREPNYFLGVGDPGVARTVGNIYDGNVNYNLASTGSGDGPSADYGACKYGDHTVKNGYQVRGGSGFNDITSATFTNNFVWVEGSPSSGTLIDATTLANFTACDNNDYRADSSLSVPFTYHGTDYSFANWKINSGLDASSTFSTSKPGSAKVFVWPNEYKNGRGMVTVVNWGLSANVSVDISSFISIGQSYRVRDVNNYFGTVVASGTYSGGTVSIPTAGVTCATPIGYGFTPATLGPEFNCWIVEKV
jgi:hypothetical protein